ncbi:STAS domain-containing protein [Rhodococcus sp. (in: high G+C Gram-positive bacteria)]
MTSEAASFSLSVDRPDNGSIVVSVRGALTVPGNSRLLADCLVAVAASDRPLTVDLGEVSEIGSAAANLIVDVARRLSCTGFRLSVVPPTSVDDREMRILGEHVHIEWVDERHAGMTRPGTRTVAVDALQGTYL